MDHTTYLLRRNNAAVDAKLAQQRLGCHALFTGRRFFGDRLSVAAFQNLVGLQGDLQQGYQGFHPAGRFQKDRPHRQGRLHLMMQQFDVVLFFELGEQFIVTVVQGRVNRPNWDTPADTRSGYR
jgi:hypothetical protein